MKKSLLLISAALVAAGAVAQPRAIQPNVAKAKASLPASASQVLNMANGYEFPQMQMATESQRQAAKAARKAGVNVKAWYHRPAGSMYRSVTSDIGAFYSGFLFSPAYRDITFMNASTGATSYNWSVEKYNLDVDSFQTVTSNDVNFTGNFIQESAYAPTLTAINGATTDTYSMTAYYYDESAKSYTPYEGFIGEALDPHATMAAGTNPIDAYLTPKFFAASTRNNTDALDGVVAYRGARDASGGTSAAWFGRNWGGYNAMGLYVEKPAYRYALRKVVVGYINYAGTGKADLTATVYKVARHDADTLMLGDEIAKGTATLDSSSAAAGFLEFPFKVTEDGLEYEYTLDVDDAIAIVISGYDNDNITSWSMLISGDQEDEGYGQHGYMMHVGNDGKPSYAWGLDRFFQTSLGCTAPSVFLDVEWPLLEYYYVNTQTGEPIGREIEIPAAGGSQDVEIYSSHGSDEWSVVDANGNVLPDWITYETSDSTANDEYTGHSHITFTANALPAGTAGRRTVAYISYPGARLPITITQGTVSVTGDLNGDGVVNTQDVTALVTAILGGQTDAIYDIDGNGTINTADVTALVSIALGN